MSTMRAIFLGLTIAISSHVMSAETPRSIAYASPSAGFPNLPHSSRWVGTAERAAPAQKGKIGLTLYNPICVEPDKPCNGDTWHGDPREAFNNGGWIEVLDTQVSGITNSLERVTVYGTSLNSWPNALCISSECRIYDLPLLDIAKQSPEPVSEVLLDWLFPRQRIELRACTILANTSSDAKSTTSHDSAVNRTRAAGEIILAYTRGANTTGMHDAKFHIIFSDEGSETYKYTVMNPLAPRSTGNLTLGDGVSKCGN